MNAAEKEPAPIQNEKPFIQDLVLKDIEARKAYGLKKYGTLLQPDNGRDALNDLYQEILDAAVYCRQEIEEQRGNSDLAYFAGIMDGEGCYSVTANRGSWLKAAIQITNTDWPLLTWIQQFAGGETYERKSYKGKRRSWVWHLSLQPAAVLTVRIMPWLITKHSQAEWFIELAASRNVAARRRGNMALTEREHELVALIRKDKMPKEWEE